MECSEEEIVFEPEIDASTTEVPVKSEMNSDDEPMIPEIGDSSYVIETAEEENQIDTIADDEAVDQPSGTVVKGRRAKKSTKQSPKPKRPVGQQDKVHQCDKCEKIFNRATHLKRHMATHSEGNLVFRVLD